jgi:sugar phosphate isomerase/epimerase
MAQQDLSKLCIHTMTTKPLDIFAAADLYAKEGVPGITVWRQALEGKSIPAVKQHLAKNGLKVVSLCRGGFFPANEGAKRQAAIDDNKKAVDEAAALGAPIIVLVCGAVPGIPLPEARRQIADGIRAVLPYAKAAGVKLSIEPLHPMYAGDRSAVNTMKQANDLCQEIGGPDIGVAVDVYHLWWDPDLEAELARCGKNGWLHAFHICDWRSPTIDLLNDRGLMGEGCIDIPRIRGWVEATGFRGFNEVEIFSDRLWAMDQGEYVRMIKDAYLKHG